MEKTFTAADARKNFESSKDIRVLEIIYKRLEEISRFDNKAYITAESLSPVQKHMLMDSGYTIAECSWSKRVFLNRYQILTW